MAMSATDLQVLDQLRRADDHLATRQQLVAALGLPADDANLLNATLYRLRRRIECAINRRSPLQSCQRQGYQFTAPLQHA